ncbi:MAG TPA: M20/M25/M40 family metallo-hydrolase [Actinospica sp.]|jgi:acetylornithine deacetylase/succinyl-diaminopimelate desuccinylase-like protein|nr:M20/M25/M40 family metallo-hydrolase [Actinospica sp.]
MAPHPELAAKIDSLLPGLTEDLVRLAEIPSVSFPGFPREEMLRAHDLLVELLRGAGVQEIRDLTLPDTNPVITGFIPPPAPDAPTVLLYAHYDVQPPGDEALWDSPPFRPTRVDGAIRARGIADDKSNLLVHLGALRAFDGRPPVGVKVVFEGQQEYGSVFDEYPPQHPEDFACDAMVIADMGNVRPGVGTLTVALRGAAEVIVEVRTLEEARHGGAFGGAAPDALLVLLHALATLHDEFGDVAVKGLRRDEWTGYTHSDEEFRRLGGVLPGAPLFGTGSLGGRLWSGPAITVMGIDAPDVDGAVSAVVPYARARLNLRVHPAQDPNEAREALMEHLRGLRPFGIPLEVTAHGEAGSGFAADTSGPAYLAADDALRESWGAPPVYAASGESIPLVSGLAKAVPDAEVLLFGAQDAECGLHGPNERVLLSELRGAVLAEARFFERYAAGYARP